MSNVIHQPLIYYQIGCPILQQIRKLNFFLLCRRMCSKQCNKAFIYPSVQLWSDIHYSSTNEESYFSIYRCARSSLQPALELMHKLSCQYNLAMVVVLFQRKCSQPGGLYSLWEGYNLALLSSTSTSSLWFLVCVVGRRNIWILQKMVIYIGHLVPFIHIYWRVRYKLYGNKRVKMTNQGTNYRLWAKAM